MEKLTAMLATVTDTCIKPKSQESALVICDNRPTSREVGFQLYNILKARTADTGYIGYRAPKRWNRASGHDRQRDAQGGHHSRHR